MRSEFSRGSHHFVGARWQVKLTPHRESQSHIVLPLSTFADQDILKVISDNQEKGSEERKILEAKRAAVRISGQVKKTEEAVMTTFPAMGEADEEVTDDEEWGEKGEEAGGSGADANRPNAGPIHEGVTCDGCQVGIFPFPTVDSSLTDDRFRLVVPLSVPVGNSQFAQTTTFAIAATRRVSTTNTRCLKSSTRQTRIQSGKWYAWYILFLKSKLWF
jgi:hypothetical protein